MRDEELEESKIIKAQLYLIKKLNIKEMVKLDIKESIEINTPSAKAWDIIGPNFANIGDWGRGINKSWKNEDVKISIEGAPAGGRFCDLGKFGFADEKIIHYNEQNKEISWIASISKMPSFVKNLENELKVETISEDTGRVTTNISANLTGIGGFIMGGMMKKNMNKLLKGFVKDWKTYAETGEVSETKKRENAKLGK